MSETKKVIPKLKEKGPLNLFEILEKEFSVRRKRNPRYSLRAFAKSINVSHSILSLVFSKKRKFSSKTALKIIKELNLNPQDFDLSSFSSRSDSKNFDEDYAFIDLDTFKKISNWVHYAILSLLQVKIDKNMNNNYSDWIAKKLDISKKEAKQSFERLVEIGLIKKTVYGNWIQSGKPIKVENTETTDFTKQFHVGLLEKAINTLLNNKSLPHDYSSMTMAIDPELIPYAKTKIRNFRRKLTADLESRGKPEVVYNLTVQIYPVSK